MNQEFPDCWQTSQLCEAHLWRENDESNFHCNLKVDIHNLTFPNIQGGKKKAFVFRRRHLVKKISKPHGHGDPWISILRGIGKSKLTQKRATIYTVFFFDDPEDYRDGLRSLQWNM